MTSQTDRFRWLTPYSSASLSPGTQWTGTDVVGTDLTQFSMFDQPLFEKQTVYTFSCVLPVLFAIPSKQGGNSAVITSRAHARHRPVELCNSGNGSGRQKICTVRTHQEHNVIQAPRATDAYVRSSGHVVHVGHDCHMR